MSLKTLYREVLITSALYLVMANSRGQNTVFEFDHLSSVNGLSQNNPLITFQDSKGFIWIGTEDGLNLYNGYECRIYRNDPNDLHSLGGSFVRAIVEDKESNLWIGTQDGLNAYIRDKDIFVRYYQISGDSNSIVSNGIQKLFLDSKNRLWISTEEGVNIFDLETRKMSLIKHDPGTYNSLASNVTRNIVEDKQGRIWIATFGGISLYDPENNTFKKFTHDPADFQSLSSNKILELFIDSKNRLWVGTFDNGLNLLTDIAGNTFKRFTADLSDKNSLPNNLVNSIAENAKDVIWIGTSGGLCYYNEITGDFVTVTNQAEDEKGLSSIDVAHVFFDNVDRMWVGTRFGGINIYDGEKNKFNHYKNIKSDITSLRGENVTSFAEDNEGNVWIGVDGGGLNYFNRQTGKFSHIVTDPDNPQGLTNDKILALCLDSLGMLWIGMWDGGVNVYNPETETFKHYKRNPDDNSSLCGNNVFYIFEDSHKAIWIATWGSDGICRYNRENDNFTSYRNDPLDSTSIGISGSVMMMEDHLGNLWIPTEGAGLNMYNREKNSFSHYVVVTEPGKENTGLSNLAVYCVFEDSKKRLWVGTNGGGLNLLNREQQTFNYYRMADGLPNDVIYGILEDNAGNLWISTNNGLCKFNPDSLSFKNYSISDGLQGNQFGRWAFKKLHTGELLFGGVNGFNLFDPGNIKENSFVPPVYIIGFKLFNQPVPIDENSALKQNIIVTKKIVLKPKQNVFSFEFVALNYRQSEKNQYMYKMEGFNDDWIKLGSQREASFTNLNPGRYTFRVKASNNDGIWNEEGASIQIVVVSPWYKTWLFRILMLLTVGGIIFNRVRAREKNQKEMKEYLENKVSEGEMELQKRMAVIESHQQALKEKEIAESESNWYNEGMTNLDEIITKNNDNLNQLARNLVPALVEYIGASLGAFYVLSSGDDLQHKFELAGSYGIGPERVKQQFEGNEGYLGACYNEKHTIAVDNLPDNYSVMESGLGKVSLKYMLLVPIMHNNIVNGIIELSSLDKMPSYKIRLLEKLAENLSSMIEIIIVNDRMKKLVEQLNSHTEELNAQQEEMRQNLEELQATQEEIERVRTKEKEREKELKKQNKELIKRQEELKDLEQKYKRLMTNYNKLTKK
jgi:ligand-binding sensor domain-containing protein